MGSPQFNNYRCNCVIYLLLDRGYSEQWQSNIDHFIARQLNIKTVLVGDLWVCERFKKTSTLDGQELLSLQLNTRVVDIYRNLFNYHQHTPFTDLLLIKSDVFISEIDISIFAKVLSYNPHIGTISPLTNQGKLFNLFVEKQKDISLPLINKLLGRIDDLIPFETPFFYPNIIYWRYQALHDALQMVGLNNDVMSLAIAANNSGYLHVVTPSIYIQDNTKQAVKVTHKIDKHPLSAPIIMHHPLTGLKQRMRELIHNIQSNKDFGLVHSGPIQLHVMHSWGGGLHRWVSDYIDADNIGKNYTLKSIGDWGAFGKRLSLYNHPEDVQAIRHWDLYHPIHGTVLVHLQYAKIIQSIIDEYGIDIILVSSLIGHSLDVLDSGINTFLVLHDYYPFCPAIYTYYDGICENCDTQHLKQCEANNPFNYYFKGVSTELWMAVRKRYINLIAQNKIVLIAPSQSVEQHLKLLFPELGNSEFACIPHGLPDQLTFMKKVEPSRKKRLKIIILGKLDVQKGLALLKQMASDITEFADLILLGCGAEGDKFLKIKGITIERSYHYTELNAKLRFYAPDLGLLFSIWPETFSYTLSELMAHAIPSVVTAHGAPLDRITDQKNGFLVNSDPQQIISLLQKLAKNPDRLDKVRNQLLTQDIRTASMMVADYQHLFNRQGAEQFNSLAMNCLSDQPPQPDIDSQKRILTSEGDFFEVMQQLQQHLIGMINKVPNVNIYTRKLFTACVRIWIFLPVRFASWYVKRNNR